jgi:hypothetical protein
MLTTCSANPSSYCYYTNNTDMDLDFQSFFPFVYYFYILMTQVNWDIAPRLWGYSFRRSGQPRCFYIPLTDTLNM